MGPRFFEMPVDKWKRPGHLGEDHNILALEDEYSTEILPALLSVVKENVCEKN
jgi:hypothetical protein